MHSRPDDAQQVADRFHVVKNFADALEPIFARCWASLPSPETMIFRDAPSPPPSPPAPVLSGLPQSLPAERDGARRVAARTPEVQARFAVKQQQFAEVMTLAAEQVSPQKIAATLGLSPRTVSRWILTKQHPGSRPRRQYPRMMDPFAGYLRLRWQQGCQDVTVLWQEVQARGFRGSQRTLYRFVEILKTEHPRPPHVPPERPSELPPLDFEFLLDYSYRDALWWFIPAPAKLSSRLTRAVEALCHVSLPLRHLYTLAQSLVGMVRTRCGEQLDGWLAEAHQCEFPEVRRFAQGVVRDYRLSRQDSPRFIPMEWSRGS